MEDILRELILDNRSLIYSVVHRFKGDDYDDMYQAGCLGLINAYRNYNVKSNVKFTTYAYPYIVGEIYKYIINNRNIHVSPMNIKLLHSINKAQDYLTNRLGRVPNDEELCSFLEIDLYKLYEIRNMANVESLDYHYEKSNLYDFLADNTLSKDQLIDLSSALKSLTKEERELIKERYYNNVSQTELARVYNTNQVKISRDEKKILCKLKAKMF